MVCYRRFGHNEADEPAFTQPRMYELIDAHRSVRKLYTETLVNRGDLSLERGGGRARRLPGPARPRAFEETHASAAPEPRGQRRRAPRRSRPRRRRAWTARRRSSGSSNALVTLARGLPRATRSSSGSCTAGGTEFDSGSRRLGARRGVRVRLARCSRARRCASPARTRGAGTFSQRHGVLVDTRPSRSTCQLAHLSADQAPFMLYDSVLSEYAALGLRVRLLGRGSPGLGRLGGAVRRLHERRADHHRPVHRRGRGQVGPDLRARRCSSPTASRARARSTRARGIERFLALCAEDNLRVVYPSTAAQYFHVLRRQVAGARPQAARLLHAEALPAHGPGTGPASTSSPRARSTRRSTTRRATLDAGARATRAAVHAARSATS